MSANLSLPFEYRHIVLSRCHFQCEGHAADTGTDYSYFLASAREIIGVWLAPAGESNQGFFQERQIQGFI